MHRLYPFHLIISRSGTNKTDIYNFLLLLFFFRLFFRRIIDLSIQLLYFHLQLVCVLCSLMHACDAKLIPFSFSFKYALLFLVYVNISFIVAISIQRTNEAKKSFHSIFHSFSFRLKATVLRQRKSCTTSIRQNKNKITLNEMKSYFSFQKKKHPNNVFVSFLIEMECRAQDCCLWLVPQRSVRMEGTSKKK